MTPLQGALIAAAIANNGHPDAAVPDRQLQGPDLTTSDMTRDPQELRSPVSRQVAAELRDMMDSVVTSGTGTTARIDGFEVGGKTGTAQNGDDARTTGGSSGTRCKNGQPVVAVAVLLQNAGNGGSERGDPRSPVRS